MLAITIDYTSDHITHWNDRSSLILHLSDNGCQHNVLLFSIMTPAKRTNDKRHLL